MVEALKEEKKEVALGDLPIQFFIGVPSYSRSISVPCVMGLVNAVQIFYQNRINFKFKFEVGMCWISWARNAIVREFLESEANDLIFIDDDIGFPPSAFRDLISQGEEVVAGVYPKKQADECYAALLKTNAKNELMLVDGLVEAEGLPTGFIKIKRSVFEKMIAANSVDFYEDPRCGKKTYDFFGEFMRDGKKLGDDYGFSMRCRDLGIRLWAIPDITFIHTGSKDYEGNLHQFLMRPQQMGKKFEPGKGEGPTWITKPSAN